MRQRDVNEAERLLRRVLDAVGRGDLSADGPAATAVARRLEGAVLALSAFGGSAPAGREGGGADGAAT